MSSHENNIRTLAIVIIHSICTLGVVIIHSADRSSKKQKDEHSG